MGCGSSTEAQPASNDKISPYELEIIKTNTRFREDEIQTWYEAFVWEHPNGEMDRAGFVSLYSRLYPKGSVEDFANHLFLAYDKDRSGKIDFQEFMATMDISQKGTSDEKLKWAFGLYDADGSGHISKEEVVQIVTAIYKMQGAPTGGDAEHVSVDESVETIFTTLEKDNDGQLDKDEFIIGSKSDPKVRRVLASV